MKTVKSVLLTSLIASSALGASCIANTNALSNQYSNDNFIVKLGAANINGPHSHSNVAPVIELAKRFDVNNAAIELSARYSHANTDNQDSMFYSLPKITYLAFYTPNCVNSFFYGGGLSWSKTRHYNSVNTNNTASFQGLYAEGVVGYEMHRDKKIKTTLELNVSQPVLASSQHGRNPGPSVFATLGFGFL